MFRSARLEALFGKRLDQVTFDDVLALVGKPAAAEDADLDYKEQVHAKSDREKTEFRKDVVAMGNDQGGILIVGVKEDNRAVPESIPKVDVSDAERRRLTDVLLHISPHLPVTIKAVEDPQDPDRGVLLVMVERSVLAPHALLDTQSNTHHKDGWVRYPIRNGAATRWMQEPEVATRYRRRFTEARGLDERLDEIEKDAFTAYANRYPRRQTMVPAFEERQALPAVTIALVPELPGSLRLNRQVFSAFQEDVLLERIIGESGSAVFTDTGVSSGRLLGIAGGASATTRYGELHADGSGVLVFNLDPFPDQVDGERTAKVRPPLCVAWVLSALLLLGKHSRDRVGASGVASIRLRILADIGNAHFDPGDARSGECFLQTVDLNDWAVGRRVEEALGTADSFVDDVADEGPDLVSATSLLVDQAFHAFGMPEVPLVTAAGQIVPAQWGRYRNPIEQWAQDFGLIL